MIRYCILILAAFAAVACTPVAGPAPFRAKFDREVFLREVAAIDTAEKVRGLVSNTTSRSISRTHGNQVEFISSNGLTFLWYPGNRTIVPGRWKADMGEVRTSRASKIEVKPRICFQYGRDTFNPVTQTQGGEWECRNIAVWMINTHEIRNRDVFGLSRRLPYVLPRYPELTMTELFARGGVTVNLGPNKAIWRENLQ